MNTDKKDQRNGAEDAALAEMLKRHAAYNAVAMAETNLDMARKNLEQVKVLIGTLGQQAVPVIETEIQPQMDTDGHK